MAPLGPQPALWNPLVRAHQEDPAIGRGSHFAGPPQGCGGRAVRADHNDWLRCSLSSLLPYILYLIYYMNLETKQPEAKSRRTEQIEATRRALLDSARELFAERGYVDVGTEEIVRRARVTRGALYHHFRCKEDLFRAVYEEVSGELGRRAAQGAMGETNPWERLQTGARAFLDACLDPAMQRITVLDGPAVLGWETTRELDKQAGLGIAEAVIDEAMEAGAIEPGPVRPLAHLLLAVLYEGAMMIGWAEDRSAAREEVGATIDRLFAGLRTSAEES